MTQVACFVSIFLHAEDGEKGLKEAQRGAEAILRKHGGSLGSVAAGKGGRRVTIHTSVDAKRGETSQQTIDRVCAEITKETGRSTAGRPEGWNPRKG
jgi:hypothetical protein